MLVTNGVESFDMDNLPPQPEGFDDVPLFLEHRTAWLAGEISLRELLTIPRKPLVIGTVPNPEEFTASMPNYYHVRPELHAGGLRRVIDNPTNKVYVHPSNMLIKLIPTLRIIGDFATRLGINTMTTSTGIAPVSRMITSSSGTAVLHLDRADERKVLLSCVIADKDPTDVVVDSVDVPEDVAESKINAAIWHKKDGKRIWHAKPYEIIAFDGTIPHCTPAPPEPNNDEAVVRRKRLQVLFVA